MRSTLFCLLLLTVGCSTPDSPADADTRPVTLALNWLPDSQHGGFYAARHFGYFRDEGLDVKIEPGGPAAPVVQIVGLRRVDFGVGNADQILMAREQQIPVVALMAAMQNSPRCIMVHEETGFKKLEDLAGIKLAIGAGKAFGHYLDVHGILDDVQVVNYTGSILPFLADQRFAQQAYIFSEPFVAEQRGAKPVCMMVSELGFNPYSSCLFTHEQLLGENPELVEKMVRAVRRGWQAYLRNPEPVNQLIHADNPEMDLESLQFGAQAMANLCLPEGLPAEQIGSMSADRWRTLWQQLADLGFVSEESSSNDAYTLRFLNESW